MRKHIDLSLVFCLTLGLTSASVRADDAEDKAVEALRKLGAKVAVIPERSDKPKPLSVSFGGTKVSDAELPPLKSLNRYALDLRETRVQTLQALEGLSSLRFLDLRDTPVSDAGLARLRRIRRAKIPEPPPGEQAA